MSVLIKGMKMPGRCYGCRFADSFHGLCIVCGNHIPADWQTQKSQHHRPKWCPLIKVETPHGRLIDSDKVEEHVRIMREVNGISRGFEDYALAYGAAQAVIEAEDDK